MHVLSRKRLRQFWQQHRDAEGPLRAWFKFASKARWRNFADVRADLPRADGVGRLVVFDIGGNKYRLIAAIDLERGKVYVRDVLTHKEYDRGQWKRD